MKVISGEIAKQGKAYERFRREAEILQQFRHPNIVRFLALGRYKGTSYFAMEYVAGETLEQLLTRRGPLPWREVVDLGIQICEALHYAHEHGVVHRDLKPSNLMVTEQGQIKLTDFGIAKDLDATALTATGRTLGTAAYMAPEQIRGTPEVSHKTDLYALGIVLYQMLTGQAAVLGSLGGRPDALPAQPASPAAQRQGARDPGGARRPDRQADGQGPRRPPLGRGGGGPDADRAPRQGREGREDRHGLVRRDRQGRPHACRVRYGSRSRREGEGRKQGLGPLILSRAMVETAALVLTLLVLGAGIAYVVWPPSQEYLFSHAKALMDSKSSADWSLALRNYIDPLDRRFPDNPYKAETRAWRDRILLEQAEGRAPMLDSPVRSHFNEPKTEGERQYVEFSSLARKNSERGDDRPRRNSGTSWPARSTATTTPTTANGRCSRGSGPTS